MHRKDVVMNAFTPVSEMLLDDLYNERLGLEYWSEVLQDTQPEQTQKRIDELSQEIEKREEVPEYIRTLKAAAELLDISSQRVKQLIDDGTLQAEDISTSSRNRKWMISLASIEAYKASRNLTGWYYRKKYDSELNINQGVKPV